MPGEDDTTDPDNDYTDPDTGEPVAPTPGAGNLLALHDGGLSYSENGGHTWHAAANTPALPLDISALTDGVLIRATDGRAYHAPYSLAYSNVPGAYVALDLDRTEESDLVLINGDFEEGDLTEWTPSAGTKPPVVLDTVQPAQQGGTWNLTNDGEEFEISQLVPIPTSDSGEVTLTAAVYTNDGSRAQIEVRSGWNGTTYSFPDVRIPPGDYVNADIDSSSMSLLSLSGDGAERISDLDYMEAQQEDGKFIEWSFHDALGNGRWYGKREHDGLWNDDLRFAQDRPVELTNPNLPGQSALLHIPGGGGRRWGIRTPSQGIAISSPTVAGSPRRSM